MKDDLISRQMLLEYIHGEPVGRLLCDKYNLDGLIKHFPSAEPEQKKGEWIEHEDGLILCECSECHEKYMLYEEHVLGRNFCPNCGADMRGGNNAVN